MAHGYHGSGELIKAGSSFSKRYSKYWLFKKKYKQVQVYLITTSLNITWISIKQSNGYFSIVLMLVTSL